LLEFDSQIYIHQITAQQFFERMFNMNNMIVIVVVKVMPTPWLNHIQDFFSKEHSLKGGKVEKKD